MSTTAVTNALIKKRLDKVKLYTLPGPGIDNEMMFPEKPYILSGYIEHRGRMVYEPAEEEFLKSIDAAGESVYAVSVKFSVRNQLHEQKLAKWLTEYCSPEFIALGLELSGALNFLRRTNSAYFNSAVWRHFNSFADAVAAAVVKRGITAHLYILKADGVQFP